MTNMCPAAANWTAWTEYTECSETCDGGVQSRTRTRPCIGFQCIPDKETE